MDWTAIIVALVGGGVISTIISCIANRNKTQAEVDSIYGKIYQDRIDSLTNRATSLEARVEKLEKIIDTLRHGIEERDDMIDELQRENDELKSEIEKLQAENECKERKIVKLQAQVKELESRLDLMDKEHEE